MTDPNTSDPKINRMEPHGPADTGMVEWDPISQDDLESGEPVQRGHMYLDDADLGLSVGVWDCTAMTTKMEPYSVNEFMFILEGSVTMVLADGTEETINAGEAFVIPKGLVCQWKQPGYIRKYFVIFDDKSGTAPDEAKLKIYRPREDESVTPIDITDTSLFLGDIPKQGEHEYIVDPTGQFMVGLWDSEAFERPVVPFNRYELMCILEGSATLSDGAGNDQVFKAGDAAFVAKGAPYKWKSDGYVRKFYCIFMPTEVAAASNAAE